MVEVGKTNRRAWSDPARCIWWEATTCVILSSPPHYYGHLLRPDRLVRFLGLTVTELSTRRQSPAMRSAVCSVDCAYLAQYCALKQICVYIKDCGLQRGSSLIMTLAFDRR